MFGVLFDKKMLFCTTLSLFASGCTGAGYNGPVSDHFNGKRFFNQQDARHERPAVLSLLKWMWQRNPKEWDAHVSHPQGLPPPQKVAAGHVRITPVGHATVLIQMGAVNVLTDPIWSERCSAVQFIGPKRVRPPAIAFEHLPPIHVVAISHNHYDHLDLPTLRRLEQKHRPVFVVPLGNGQLLRDQGIKRVQELDWWRGMWLHQGLHVQAVPAQHWSARMPPFDYNKALWAGFVFKQNDRAIYFAGDTGMGPHFQQIHQRVGAVDIALLPIGAFKPRWIMQSNHLSPQEAVAAARILQAKVSIPIHYGVFALGDDGQHEPLQVLKQHLDNMSEAPRFEIPEFGEGFLLN
ncbi:MAG: MBL fold metallo-hydrolase [Myxococcota bacterium]